MEILESDKFYDVLAKLDGTEVTVYTTHGKNFSGLLHFSRNSFVVQLIPTDKWELKRYGSSFVPIGVVFAARELKPCSSDESKDDGCDDCDESKG